MGRLNAVLCVVLMLLAAPAGSAVRLVSLSPNATAPGFPSGAGPPLVGASKSTSSPAAAPRMGDACVARPLAHRRLGAWRFAGLTHHDAESRLRTLSNHAL